LAEETGLIMALGDWVLRSACAQLVLWARQPRLAELSLAVNISPRQFAQSDFVAQVLAAIAGSGANPRRLELEVTEGLLLQDVEDTIAKMIQLKAYGLDFSLDDFGTGYSSLAYLKRLPLDQLKIDQSFVRDVLVDPNDAAIARTVVALGNSLGLRVIAEGVETEAQRVFLKRHGCDAWQGYLLSRRCPRRTSRHWCAEAFRSHEGRGVVGAGAGHGRACRVGLGSARLRRGARGLCIIGNFGALARRRGDRARAHRPHGAPGRVAGTGRRVRRPAPGDGAERGQALLRAQRRGLGGRVRRRLEQPAEPAHARREHHHDAARQPAR